MTKAPDAPAPSKHTLTEQLIPHALVQRSPAQAAPGTKGAHGGNRAAHVRPPEAGIDVLHQTLVLERLPGVQALE